MRLEVIMSRNLTAVTGAIWNANLCCFRFRFRCKCTVVECLLKNDVITAQLMLRDITNCTIGFKVLARATGITEKSLMRMLSVKGNPQAKNLFQIIYSLQQLNEVRLEIRAV